MQKMLIFAGFITLSATSYTQAGETEIPGLYHATHKKETPKQTVNRWEMVESKKTIVPLITATNQALVVQQVIKNYYDAKKDRMLPVIRQMPTVINWALVKNAQKKAQEENKSKKRRTVILGHVKPQKYPVVLAPLKPEKNLQNSTKAKL